MGKKPANKKAAPVKGKAPAKSKFDSTKNLFELEDATIELTDRQKLFCMKYLESKFNGTEAAKQAGYAENSANEQAARLLANDSIKAYIELLKKDLGLRIGISQERIALELAKIAFSDVKSLMTVDGGFKGVHALDNEVTASISSVEISDIMTEDGPAGRLCKIKLWDKRAALADLNKMLGYNAPEKHANTDTSGNDVTPEFVIIHKGVEPPTE